MDCHGVYEKAISLNLLVIINFVVFLFLNIYSDMKAKRRGIEAKWDAPINKGVFVLGKCSLVSCWLLFLIHAFGLQWSFVSRASLFVLAVNYSSSPLPMSLLVSLI